MKRIITLILITLLIAVPVFAGTVIYKLTQAQYPVLVDGQAIKSNLPVMTYRTAQGDNTYVPMRVVLEMMGAKVLWNGSANITTPQADPTKVANSVVEIYVSKNGMDVKQGSGVIIGYDEIVTCSHVADKGDSYRIIYNDGTTTTAKLVKDNPAVDIAVLDPVKEDVKPTKIGDSDEVKVGDKVFVISSPDEKRNVVSEGKVLSIDDKSIYVTATGNNGSSGGGLFLAKNGEIVGMVDSGNDITKYCDAIPINDVRKAMSN